MKKGFTLAEVLITLGIIGVVATLTLPNLMADYKKKTYVAQLQRTYNMLTNAFQNYMVDQDAGSLNDTPLLCSSNTDESCQNAVKYFLTHYFKVSKDCGLTETGSSPCFGSVYKSVTALEPSGFLYDYHDYGELYCVNVNTGATICINGLTNQDAMIVAIDINGKKAPNTMGRDGFYLRANNKGDVSEGFVVGFNPDECYVRADGGGYGDACFTKIVNDGWVMDY